MAPRVSQSIQSIRHNLTARTSMSASSTRGALSTSLIVAAAALCIAFATGSAHAQCLKVTTVRGKAKLSTTAPGFSGKCPVGTVAIGGTSGAVGAPGAQGPQGPAGARGPSAFDVIPSGTTVYGVIGLEDYRSANVSFQMYTSLPALASTPIAADNVIIKANEELLSECSGMICLTARQQAAQGLCQGSHNNPKAAPGTVCIYPTYVYGGIQNGSLSGYDIWAGDTRGSRAGFSIGYSTAIAAYHQFEGIWAYTAP